MPRPCPHGRDDAPPAPDRCPVCRLYVADPAYRQLWEGRSEPPPRPNRPCRHRGPLVPLGERYRLGLGTLRDWYPCAKGLGVNGYACPCRGCGPRCPEYEPRPKEEDDEDVTAIETDPPATAEPTPLADPPNLQCEAANPDQSVDEMMDLIRYCPPGPWPDGWHGWANVHEAHKRLLAEYAARLPPYPTGRFKPGRCIVSCVSAKPGHSSGKHLKHGYLPAAWVLANELRRLGCTLPVYFCHLGPLEWSPRLTEIVEPLNVQVIDLRSVERRHPARILAGWESKAYAVEHAPYEEVLFLDADNVPVRDPSYLFEEPKYQEYGALFWPDLPPWDRKEWLPAVVWDAVGLPYDPGCDFESGQLLIHKRKCWDALKLTRWINDHSDRYYKIIFGDKSTFRLGWARAGRAYGLPRSAGWNGGAILQHDMQGRLLFEHCVQNKPTLEGYPKTAGDLPKHLTHPGEIRDHLARLRDLWDGRLWDGAEGADLELAESLIGKSFLYRRIGLGERVIRLLEDDRVGKGGARCEFSWGVQGGKLAVSDVDGKPTMILDRRPDGVWAGEWLEHEKCAVELIPVD